MEIKVNFSEQEEKLQTSFGDLNTIHDGIKRIFVGGVEQTVENYIAYLDAYPSRLAELLDDANHRLMTDVEKALLHSHYNKSLIDSITQTNLVSSEDRKNWNKPYTSLRRLGNYLYEITFDTFPEADTLDELTFYGCTSFVKDGKLYRNLDWNYGNTAEFKIKIKNIEGMTFIDGLDDGNLDNDKLIQLPYRICDGRNIDTGIRVSTHVLFNDWNYQGSGNKNIPLTKLPYLILGTMSNVNTVSDEINELLNNMCVPSNGLLIQVMVTDGVTTKLFTPDTDGYHYIDISSNPKLTNFKWVNRAIVNRNDADLQRRPTGIERWNMIENDDVTLEDLRFTLAYESPSRLSEFIGIDETTKDSPDSELMGIYNRAHAAYERRTRDNTLWQTMHSVCYDKFKMNFLYTQENYDNNYVSVIDADYEHIDKSEVTANSAARHTHVNKELLDTYTQTNSNIADAVSKKHTHTNKELLDTYNQTNSDISDAVSKKHAHANKELLDTYNQTNSNIADAVSKKHAHANMNVLNAMEVAYTLDKDAKLLVSTQVQDNHVILNGSILIDGVATIVYDDSEIRQAISKMEVGWVINTKSQITGTEDFDGNFTNVTAITGLDLSLIKIGDNIYVKDTSAPDYWVSGKTNNVLSLNVLDTKTDLSNYYNKTEINALLALKQDSIADLIAIRNGAALGATAVQPTRKINGKDLSADRTIRAEDIPLDTATGNNVDAALAKLQNDMPTKTSDLINDSGFITTVPVTDVRINGTSIILSGIGNIPIAGDSRLGVVRVRATDGITINDEGRIIINRATNEQIQAKTTTTMPIVPANLDKAIMEGLGNNSLTWSSAYKASARATIGAGTSDFSGNYNDLTNKPSIPTDNDIHTMGYLKLADLPIWDGGVIDVN